jgi:hypothetical protein
MFARQDWATFTGATTPVASKVVTAEDLIGPDGSCAGMQVVPAAAPDGAVPADAATAAPDGTTGQAPGAEGAPVVDPLPPRTGGIALGMTECEVARRAGRPEHVEVGADDRGERSVVLSYMRGEKAGIYRFREGRLFTVERVVVAEPEKPKKPVKTAKPAKPKAPRTAAVKPAAKPAAGTAPAWPSAPKQAPAQTPAQSAPWPSPQQSSAAPSAVWPSPPPLRSGQ